MLLLLLLLRRAFVSTKTRVYANTAYYNILVYILYYIYISCRGSGIYQDRLIYIILGIFINTYKYYSMWTVRFLYHVVGFLMLTLFKNMIGSKYLCILYKILTMNQLRIIDLNIIIYAIISQHICHDLCC